MLPVTKCPMGPNLHIYKMAAIRTANNANCYNSLTNQLIFIILVLKIWFSCMPNPFLAFKKSSIIRKGPQNQDGGQSRLQSHV